MVRQKEKGNNIFYQCEECGLLYKDAKMAKECQAWCREHKSCNLEIIKHAVGEQESPIS